MTPLPKWFITLCWVMAIGFSICVGLQVNDPDPIRWMVIYGAGAIAAALLTGHRLFAIAAGLIGLVAAAWGAYLARQVYDNLAFTDLWKRMSEKGGAVEVGREAGGLCLMALFLLLGSGFRALRP